MTDIGPRVESSLFALDYIRHGTKALIAALDVATGNVRRRHLRYAHWPRQLVRPLLSRHVIVPGHAIIRE